MYPQEASQDTFDRLMTRIPVLDDRGPQRQTGDENLIVRFQYEAVENKANSVAAGMKKFDNILFVYIQAAGQRDNVVRKATEEDKARFSKQYEAFLNKQETVIDGTPIEMWPILTPAEVAELKHQKIYSIEQIKNLPDSRLSQMGLYGRQLRDKANDYFSTAARNAPITAMRSENEKLRSELGRLLELCNKLAAQVAGFTGQPMIPVQADVAPVTPAIIEVNDVIEKPKVKKVRATTPKIEIE